MDFPSKLQKPLLYNRKRVDNSDIEEQQIASYDATWRRLDESLTKLNRVLNVHISLISGLQKSTNGVKKELNLSLRVSKSLNDVHKEKCLVDKYVYRQSGMYSHNVATNYAKMKKEIDELLIRVSLFITEVADNLESFFVREKNISKEISLLSEMVRKTVETRFC